ncbi:MAG: sulfatase-like hydrolase/transferase [Phycisphaerae bacterium]|nr:sulfatase-like hydrolase/transferase [Phycisphaerae bacterium]
MIKSNLSRRNFIKMTCLTAAASTLSVSAMAKGAKKPNVIFIYTDDQRPDTIGALGNDKIMTPNIDKLYKRGFAFTSAYCMGSNSGAVCMPSRTMALSGRSVFDIKQYRKGELADQDNPDIRTWPAAMNASGYATMRTGKSGNHPVSITHQFDQDIDIRRREDCTEEHADNAIKFIEDNSGKKPFFLYLATATPHDPQPAPEKYYAMYDPDDMPLSPNFLPLHPFDNGEMIVRDEKMLPHPRTKKDVRQKIANYYASITYTDDQIGRIMDALEEAGQMDNTIIVFASDNGLSLGDHGLLGKQNLYENGGMHVPLCFVGPGIPAGKSDAMVYLFDIYPTVCQLAGLHAPKKLDGQSLVPVITGKRQEARDAIFCIYKDVQRSVRTDRWKLIRYPQVDMTQLFDLQKDPFEMNNLVGNRKYSKKVDEMLSLLKAQQKKFNDVLPLTVEDPKSAEITADQVNARIQEEPKKLKKEKKKKNKKK